MSTREPDLACAEIDGLLTAFVDGELPPPSARLVERHLESCAACRGIAEEERALVEAMRARLQAIRMPAPLRSSLLARLRTEVDGDAARRQSGT